VDSGALVRSLLVAALRFSNEERRRRLAARHRLHPDARSDSVPELADSLVALHSSDPVSVFLSIAARSDGLTLADVERALYDDRTVLRHHAMRRTLWVMTPAVAQLAHAACTRKIAAAERRRTAKALGDPARFEEAVEAVIAAVTGNDRPLQTREIGERHPELTHPIVFGAGTAHETPMAMHTRAALIAAFDGAIVRTRPTGTWIGSQYAWTDTPRWTDVDWDAHDGAAATAGLVRRWLDRFGPGTLDDIVWWSGLTKTGVRRALDHVDAVEVELENNTGWCLVDDLDETVDVGPWAALLPGLDPTAMGWKVRTWYLDSTTGRRVTDRSGNIGPTVWVDGRIVGGWAQRPDGEIAIEPTTELSDSDRDLLDTEVARLREFVGDTRFRVRFPAPNQRDLLA
jgi:DNA glycosylase AlkZ-like